MDKKLKEIRKVFEKETPVSFTDHDKQKVLTNIKQGKERSNRRINHFIPTIVTAVLITMLFFIFNYQFNVIDLGFSGNNENNLPAVDIQMETTLKLNHNVVMAHKDYMLEVIIKKGNNNSNVIYPYIEGLENISFDGNEDEGYFIPNHVGSSSDDEQVAIEKLQEQQIIDQGTDYQFLGFSIPEKSGIYKMRIYFDAEDDFVPSDHMYLIYIQTENGIFGKKTKVAQLTQIDEVDVDTKNDTFTQTYKTTIDLSDALLDVYSQYEVSLDDQLLKDLNPIDIFKLYHHAYQMNDHEIVYALFIHDGTYDIPDKETYLSDIASMDDEMMKESEYYEELIEVTEFNEVYREDNEAAITFTVNSSEYDQIFQLIKDKHTNVWKVSWLPIQ